MNKNLTEKNKDYLDGIDIIYWINLDRAKDRQHHMNKIFKDNIFKNKKIIRNKAIDYKDKKLTNKYKIIVDQKAILDAIFNRQGIDNSLGE